MIDELRIDCADCEEARQRQSERLRDAQAGLELDRSREMNGAASPNSFGFLSLSRDDRLLVYALRVRESDIWLAGPER